MHFCGVCMCVSVCVKPFGYLRSASQSMATNETGPNFSAMTSASSHALSGRGTPPTNTALRQSMAWVVPVVW